MPAPTKKVFNNLSITPYRRLVIPGPPRNPVIRRSLLVIRRPRPANLPIPCAKMPFFREISSKWGLNEDGSQFFRHLSSNSALFEDGRPRLRRSKQGPGSGGTPFRPPLASSTPAPPLVSCVLAARELVSDGPLPLPGGGHVLRSQSLPAPQRFLRCRATTDDLLTAFYLRKYLGIQEIIYIFAVETNSPARRM